MEKDLDNMHKCPYCGHDRSQDLTKVRKLCAENNLISDSPNAGGRSLIFEKKGRLQISDQCNYCDGERIVEFLNEDKTVENDLDNMQIPECCDDCKHFSGDGYNDCCKHPEFIDHVFNINTRPGRTRMPGCPLENKRG